MSEPPNEEDDFIGDSNVRWRDLFAPRDTGPVIEDISMDGPMLTTMIYPLARHDLKCADCGSSMQIRTSPKFKNQPFYGCTRFPECRGTHGAHTDGRPLGTPANSETKKARIRAHVTFDYLWKHNVMSRPQAYAWLRRKMNLADDDAHIAKFDIATCDQLIALVKKEFPRTRNVWDRLLDGVAEMDENEWELAQAQQVER